MKLVFYDEMPTSPAPRPGSAYRVSHWVSQGRNLASKASDRASISIKRKLSKQHISAPLSFTTANNFPTRKGQFRTLELSIYLPGNRLSDLPKFQSADFSETGEIQVPSKALIHARSEDILPSLSNTSSRPTMSMVGERQLDYWQQRSSSAEPQRPPSSCEGLNSHPVYWTSLPGLPPPCEAVKTLSPMAEEEGSTPTSKTADKHVLEFLPIEEEQHSAPPSPASPLPPLTIQVPYKTPLRPDPPRLNSFHQNRISQWLSRSSSSIKTDSLDAQRSQFYQCAISPPVQQHSFAHPRSRSFTASMIASSAGSPTESLASMTSMTTAPTVHSPRSRSGTLRSLGKRVTVVQEESLPEVPHVYAQAREIDVGKSAIAGAARLGMAF
jgi:hypothetical protein